MEYYVAIGGNLGDPEATFRHALTTLAEHGCRILRRSRWIVTEPMLDPEQPIFGQQSFLNGALCVESDLQPEAFLALLLQVEQLFGRVRGPGEPRWGPRTLDLDLLAAEQQVITTVGLAVPHPEMHRRDFVLQPLCEIAPLWRHPVIGLTVKELYAQLRASSILSEQAEATGT